MKKVVLLVIDSLGVGHMDDVVKIRPQDVGANTLYHLLDQAQDLPIPNLEKLGINEIVCHPKLSRPTPLASHGVMNLQHYGADSYAGHQEIMGTQPKKPNIAPFVQYLQKVKQALEEAGHHVVQPDAAMPYLRVDDYIVVADNIETDYGQIYNLTGALDYIPFTHVLDVAAVVRQEVKVNRVIALGGQGITLEDIENSIEKREDGLVGVNSPKSGVYKQGYNVRHIGYGVNPATQVSTILVEHGKEVTLIGKMQDVIECQGAEKRPAVDTDLVMSEIIKAQSRTKQGLIAATVQETDLSGHSQDVERYATKLMTVDSKLGTIMGAMSTEDYLIITADHGNDPTIGHSQHTREKTPLLVYRKDMPGQDLGIRGTLSDIARSIADIFQVPPPENGKTFMA